MSPGGLSALLHQHRYPHNSFSFPVTDSYLVMGRRECEELGLIQMGRLTPKGQTYLKELCALPISALEVKL